MIRSSATSTRDNQAVHGSTLPAGIQMMTSTDYTNNFGVPEVKKELQTSSTAEPKKVHARTTLNVPGDRNPAQTLKTRQANHLSPKPPPFFDQNFAAKTP